jgi:hypothetical protein
VKPGALWALTSYFNPMRYRRRRENYHVFRRQLDVPLMAVELSFDGRFELGENDADILVRVEGGDVMWQKERLLNIGVARLPGECTAVAMVDADVMLADPGWPGAALAHLEDVPAVQLFSEARFLAPDALPPYDEAEVIVRQRSIGSARVNALDTGDGFPPTADNVRRWLAPGFAWAYRRELIARHGLFDACIVGGGDRALASTSWGAFEAVERRLSMNPHQQQHYRDWAQAWYASVQGRIGCLPGTLYHLWHGDLTQRRYGTRNLNLAPFDFNPAIDIAPHASGAWRWASDKPRLHDYVVDYFAQRREDG